MRDFIERKLIQFVERRAKRQKQKIDFVKLAPDTIIWFQPENRTKITLTEEQDVNQVIKIISEWEWYPYWHTTPDNHTGIELRRSTEILFRFSPSIIQTWAYISGEGYQENFKIADIPEG